MRLKTDFHGTVTIKSDPEQIKQVLWNIFLNATDAMPQGGRLNISTKAVNGYELSDSVAKKGYYIKSCYVDHNYIYNIKTLVFCWIDLSASEWMNNIIIMKIK